MRPPMGAAGRVVPAPSGNSTMGIIMPLYTLGIVLFFLYTIAKVQTHLKFSPFFYPIIEQNLSYVPVIANTGNAKERG